MSSRRSRRQGQDKEKQHVPDRIRAGMPASDSVREVVPFAAGSKVYRILKTTERDAYDPLPPQPKGDKKATPKKAKKAGR